MEDLLMKIKCINAKKISLLFFGFKEKYYICNTKRNNNG